MQLSNIHKVIENDKIYLNATINQHNIWFSVDKKYKDLVTDFYDPFVVAMLVPCMKSKTDMHIKGKVSAQLINSLDNLQDIIISIIPTLTKINVKADEYIKIKKTKNKNVFAGFSAGIDAFITFKDYYLEPKSDIKITHFIHNNLTYSRKIIDKKLHRIKKLQKKYNFDLIETYTNFHFMYKLVGSGINFEQTHTLRNSAIAFLLSKNDNIFLYSSTFHKDLTGLKENKDMGIADPMILSTLSTDNVKCISAGSEYTRIQKTIEVANITDAHEYLDTCIKKDKHYINCGICRKCARALATLECVNKVDLFKNIFNVEAWNKYKQTYYSNLKTHTQINDKELYFYLLEQGKINGS